MSTSRENQKPSEKQKVTPNEKKQQNQKTGTIDHKKSKSNDERTKEKPRTK